jgi:hypothetical protein
VSTHNAWLLHPLSSEIHTGQGQQRPGPIEIDGEDEWIATAVPDSRIIEGSLTSSPVNIIGLYEYKVRIYGGHDYNQAPDWQPFQDLGHKPYLVADFHHAYPERSQARRRQALMLHFIIRTAGTAYRSPGARLEADTPHGW